MRSSGRQLAARARRPGYRHSRPTICGIGESRSYTDVIPQRPPMLLSLPNVRTLIERHHVPDVLAKDRCEVIRVSLHPRSLPLRASRSTLVATPSLAQVVTCRTWPRPR